MVQNEKMEELLKGLNPVQAGAVRHTEGPVLVVAGPGSGKTRVLTFRIAYIIEKGIAPWEILTLTFTNKAAKEMKERIGKVVGPKADKVWAGTFHSLFARILRVEAAKIGYPTSFTIYDTEDSKSLLKSIIKELNLNPEHYNINNVRARISSAKSNLITPKLYAADEVRLHEDRLAKMPHLYLVYEKYSARCKKAGAMDFDDLLYRLYELFQAHPDVLEKYRQRFRYLLVDEFQDTNYLQYAIIRKLVHFEGSARNICVVGDDAQSIYAFRGATIQNILDFENDFKPFGIQTFKLEQNYRSTEPIVEAANKLIQHNSQQIPKKIWSDKGVGPAITVINARTDEEEGSRVSDTIIEQKNRYHLSNGEIAVLYRTNAQSRIIEEKLLRQNLKYQVIGGQSFYQRKEVKDLIAYMRLAVNSNDEEALKRVINFPKRGIGDATFEKIVELAERTGLSSWQCAKTIDLPTKTRSAIDRFVGMIEDFRKMLVTEDALTVANHIARASGVFDFYKADHSLEGLERFKNIESLFEGIQTFVEEVTNEQETDKSLAAYLQNISLLTDLDTATADEEKITLMSVHAAKGLEFKSVFVVGLEEKLFPSFLSMDSNEAIDEERRLFYVAITRAEKYLTLCYADIRNKFGKIVQNTPSRFLEELPQEHLQFTGSGLLRLRTQSTAPTDRLGIALEEDGRSRVIGAFRPKDKNETAPGIDPSSFKPSTPGSIQTGMKVLHQKFGEGKVLAIDGSNDNRVATIFFRAVEDSQKRLVLKFAKLMIVE